MKKKENKNKKQYHTVGTVQQSNRKFVKREKKSIPITHKYMTTHSPGLVQALLLKVAGF